MDASNNLVSPGKKRVCEFLSSCVEVKKRKVDIGMLIARKENEKLRYKEQIAKVKARIIQLTQGLAAKEMQLDSVDIELQALKEENKISC